MITSSFKVANSTRRISSESKEKILFFEESNSFLEKSNNSRYKNNPSSEKNPDSNEDVDKLSLYGNMRHKIRKTMNKEKSFKTSQSLKMKESWFPGTTKSKDFNLILRSLDSDSALEFSSYSGEEKDSETEIETFGHHFRMKKTDNLKKAYKNSMSFSFE